MDNETKERFDSVDARFDGIDVRLDKVDARLDKVDARFDKIDARLDKVDARFDKMMTGIAQQFEAMQKYMDQRFNEVIEAIEFRTSPLERQVRDHERRLRQLEKN
jgi:chaperonin cofactor prefoldin